MDSYCGDVRLCCNGLDCMSFDFAVYNGFVCPYSRAVAGGRWRWFVFRRIASCHRVVCKHVTGLMVLQDISCYSHMQPVLTRTLYAGIVW